MKTESKLARYFLTSKKQKVSVKKVAVESIVVNTTVHIPQSERKENPIFFKPIVAPEVYENIYENKNWKVILTAFFCKYPRYRFIRSTLSKYTNGRQFWLLDLDRNVTVIFTKKDIYMKLEHPLLKNKE